MAAWMLGLRYIATGDAYARAWRHMGRPARPSLDGRAGPDRRRIRARGIYFGEPAPPFRRAAAALADLGFRAGRRRASAAVIPCLRKSSYSVVL